MRALTHRHPLPALFLLTWTCTTMGAEDQPPVPEAKPVAEAQQPPLAAATLVEETVRPAPVSSPPAASLAPKKATTKQPAATAPLSVTLQLNVGNAELRGTLLSSPDFSMKTAFGELMVPMSQVAGVKMASEGNTTTTVVMHNGDSVTGAWDLDRLELQTEWGTATVDGTAINSILFVPDMAWVSERGLAGTRWELLSKPKAEETTPPPGTLKSGDIVVVAKDSELKAGTDVVGKVTKDEVLVIQGELESYYYVDTGKTAGWISKEDVAPYQEPEPAPSGANEKNVAKTRRASSR